MKLRDIPVIILAGGLGTRISEETYRIPKPMITIAGKPIIWHLIESFAQQGSRKFLIATGYKSEVIDQWIQSLDSMEIGFSNLDIEALYTGVESQTGGRVKQCLNHLNSEVSLMTYGDGLANINLDSLLISHTIANKMATVTAVRPPARFGYLKIVDGTVVHFGEKNQSDEGWINGGFFVLNRGVRNLIKNNLEAFELGPLPELAKMGELNAFQHTGFWQPMDTMRERNILNELALQKSKPWLL